MSTTYDIGLFEGNVALSGFGNITYAVTGPLKVSQKFALAFLMEVGTQEYELDFGTEFITVLKNGIVRTEMDVTTYFNEAADAVLQYMATQLTGDEPDDEVLVSAVLSNFTLDPPGLRLEVLLTTRDGTSRTIVLPTKNVEG